MGLPDARYDVFLDAAYQDADSDSYSPSRLSSSRGDEDKGGVLKGGGRSNSILERLADEESAEGLTASRSHSQGKLYSTSGTAHPVQQSKEVFGELPQAYGRERARSGSHSGTRTMAIPCLEEIESFFADIFNKSQLEGECIIISLIYCERLVKETKGRLSIRYDNWRSILFACLVMASKVWDDLSMWNVDFSHICSTFDLDRINCLELGMLDVMRYRIKVSASEYAKYYFHLRSMMARLGITSTDIATKQLDLIGARRLQLATETLQSEFSTAKTDTVTRPRRITNAARNSDYPPGAFPGRTHLHRTTSTDGASSLGHRLGGLGSMNGNSGDSNAVGSSGSGGESALAEGGIGANTRSIFNAVGLDQIMSITHTDADGVDRTAALKLKTAKERLENK